jgi:hypothetical protein
VDGTLFGGSLAFISYILVLVYLVIYVTTIQDATYPITTDIAIFPNDAASGVVLPAMNCVATSGCYIKAMQGTSDITGNARVNDCLYVASGEAVPSDFLYLFYESDPTGYLQVLSVDTDKYLAVSYDLVEVTDYSSTLTVETLSAATDDSLTTPMPYKMYKGVSIFNLIRTVGLDQTVDTWTNTVTTETTTFDGSGGCCGANVYDTSGVSYSTGTTQMTNCGSNSNTWWTTKVTPPTTYAVITVVNPLDGFELLGLIGGWLGIIFSLAGGIYWASDEYADCVEEGEQEDADDVTSRTIELVKSDEAEE